MFEQTEISLNSENAEYFANQEWRSILGVEKVMFASLNVKHGLRFGHDCRLLSGNP